MSDDDIPLDPKAYTPSHAYIHYRPTDARQAMLALTRERDEARAEVERLREALALGSEVLASHQGSPGREWHSAGAWLFSGDSINVVRAPLPEIEVES